MMGFFMFAQLIAALVGTQSSHVREGLALLEEGKLARAEQEFLQALEEEPSDPEILLLLGDVYRREKKYPESEEVLKEARSLLPDDIRPIVSLALLHYEMGDIGRAESEAKEAARLELDRKEVAKVLSLISFRRGVEALQSGDTAKALVSFREGLTYDPDNFRALMNLGNLLLKTGGSQEVLELAERSMKRFPDEPSIYLLKARALVALNRALDALPLVEGWLSRFPDNRELHLFAAELNIALGREERALEICRKMERHFPDDVEIHRKIIRLYVRSEDYESAFEEARNFASKWDDGRKGYWEMYHFAGKLGNPEKQIEVLEEALKRYPEDVGFAREMGLLLEEVDVQRAKIYYEGKEDPYFLTRSAILCEKLGDTAKALSQYMKAVEGGSRDPYPYLRLGESLTGKEPDSAFRYLKRCFELALNLQAGIGYMGLAAYGSDDIGYASEVSLKRAGERAERARDEADRAFELMREIDEDGLSRYFEGLVEEKGDNPELFIYCGRLCEGRDELERARLYFEKALRLNPKIFRAHYELAGLYKKSGDMEAAYLAFRRALELKATREVCDGLMEAARETGRERELLDYLRSKLDRGEENALLRELVGRLEKKEGFDEAR